MKTVSHWTPRYLYHRVGRYCFEKRHPHAPNLAIGATQFLEGWLKKTDVILEYGSGRSTGWFAQRVHKIISIENNPLWYEKVRVETATRVNVELCLFESDGKDKERDVPGCGVSWGYVNKTEDFPPGTFDCIFNDGWARAYVGIRALSLLKRGGILIWDDWAWSFPSSARIPIAIPPDGVIKDKTSSEFFALVKGWRYIVFEDGVHSTAIFFKPA
jgi:hypothetical protein